MKSHELHCLKNLYFISTALCITQLKCQLKGYLVSWKMYFVLLILSPSVYFAQLQPTQISPRLVYQGESFYGGNGVKEIQMDVYNVSISLGDSDFPSCNDGVANLDLYYYNNNYSDYWTTLWIPSPQARDGLSTFDLVLMQLHIDATTPFDNYNFIAADANRDGVLDAVDVNAWQAVIQNPSLPYPGGGHFFAMQNINKGNFESASQNISLYNYEGGSDQFTYYGDPVMSEDNLFSYRIIKRGDVNASNCNYCPNSCVPSYLKKPDHFRMNMEYLHNKFVNVRLKIPPNTNLIGLEWLVEDLSGNTFEIMDLKTNLKGFSEQDFRLDKKML
ncbi:MAG TPA: hypothetical protein VKZ54_09800 [Membranihabitans sp.]|nr:hypothetical protein [Membranihabitans sp.]